MKLKVLRIVSECVSDLLLLLEKENLVKMILSNV